MAKKIHLTSEDEQYIRRVLKKVETMRGDGVKNTPDSITISQIPAKRAKGSVAVPSTGSQWAKVTGHTLIEGEFYRWVYDITFVTRTPTYDGLGVLTAYTVEDVLDEESNPVVGKAVNDYEAAHTEDYAWNSDLTQLNPGLQPVPVGGKVTTEGDPPVEVVVHGYDELVEVKSIATPPIEDPDLFYVFARIGGFGGGCE